MFAKKTPSTRAPKLRLLRSLTSTVFITNVVQWDPVLSAIKELPRYKWTYGNLLQRCLYKLLRSTVIVWSISDWMKINKINNVSGTLEAIFSSVWLG